MRKQNFFRGDNNFEFENFSSANPTSTPMKSESSFEVPSRSLPHGRAAPVAESIQQSMIKTAPSIPLTTVENVPQHVKESK